MDVEMKSTLDEALYSRQLYVMGHDAMHRMGDSKVLIINCNGVGAEIAKNLTLAGVKSVGVHDLDVVSDADLASQFFLSEADIGKPRAKIVESKLQELNEYVQVTTHTEDLTPQFLAKFQVIVACCLPLERQVQINDMCRESGVLFIATASNGVFGSVFCDFGAEFTVTDTNGEPPSEGIIASITQDEKGVVNVVEDSRHNLETGDTVAFVDVKGMTELNSLPPTPVHIVDGYTFTITDTRGYQPFGGFGRFRQVKQPTAIQFVPLREALVSPAFAINFSNNERSPLLHLCYRALDQFCRDVGRLPLPGSTEDGSLFIETVRKLNADNSVTLDDKLIRIFAHCATGSICPIAAYIGGIAAQEALKACTGKFMPIRQFYYFDAVESLPSNVLQLPPTEFVPRQDLARYSGQIVVFGNTFQERLLKLKYFLVGSGAIGCEMLKNFAMMGVGCSEEGRVVTTDMDGIEKSNLNRQFLFRPWHLGRPKSLTAAEMSKAMNPNFNVVAHELRVGKETEHVFDDDFFESLDGVCNALDNVEARLYVDQRCVLFQKPLLESGTLGTKGNVQVIVPHLTESYGSSVDPPEKGIPICTLKHFPNKIEHTIQWAREEFEGLFVNQPNDVNQYLTNPAFIQTLSTQTNSRVDTIESIHKNLVTYRPITFAQCVQWARLRFEELFNHSIQQLLYNFPPDTKDKSGILFWSGSKQCPHPIQCDLTDPLHLNFLLSCANLRAFNYGLRGTDDASEIVRALEGFIVPPFQPVKGVRIPVTEAEASVLANNTSAVALSGDDRFNSVIATLPTPSSLAGYRIEPVQFEKDDDTNYHMHFITATSNLRASNYEIPLADLHTTKRIAGKIIPAIATTTALVTGLVALELYKVHLGDKKLEDFKNGFVNLAVPLFAFSDPVAPPKVVTNGKSWTLWDKIIVDQGDVTLEEFINSFQKTHEVEINMISYGRSMLFTSFSPKKLLATRFKLRMSELAQTVSKKPLAAGTKYLTMEVCCTGKDGNDVEMPTVRFRYR
eukprot:c5119_g1_i1.p1 GENE.c5119_g1_i1~~c5119_g1_i1.p1  ORF type:complete len:1014 (-),score=269.80 c5119_g1_i1:69-3110(-)